MPPVIPSPYRFRKNDYVGINYQASAAPASIRLKLGVRYDNGSFEEFTVTVETFTTDRTFISNYVGTDVTTSPGNRQFQFDGTVEYAQGLLFNGATPLKRGQLYARVVIVNPGDFEIHTLCADYMYSSISLTLGRIVDSGPGGGEGFITTVTGANPAAGAEASDAVPTNAVWRLLSYSIVLVTDATVANRFARLMIDDGATTNRRWLGSAVTTAQTAALTYAHLFQRGYGGMNTDQGTQEDPAGTVFGIVAGTLPDLDPLLEGYRLRTVTTGLQAGDNYAAPIFQVEEWLVS